MTNTKMTPTQNESKRTLLLRRAELSRAMAEIDERLAEVDDAGSSASYGTYALPPDATRDAFHRACRSGRVQGARKIGRAWTCSVEAWERRDPPPAPSIARGNKLRAKPLRRERDAIDVDVLDELGLARGAS